MIIIDQTELDFLKWDEQITQQDIVEIIEHREVFEKLCRKSIRKIRIDLANLLYRDREKEAYSEIKALSELINSMWSTINNYKQYMDEIEKKE